MSDVPTPPSDPTPPPTAPTPAEKPSRKPSRWRRRILVAIIVLFALATVGRLLVGILLPVVLDRVVAFYDLSATYDRAALSLTNGNLTLSNLTLRPKEGGEPIAHAEYIYGNISPLQLLHGQLYVYRAEVDGISLNIDRNADGSIPLLTRFVPATAKTTNTSPTSPPKPVDLASPLKVEAFRLTHVNAHIRDQHISPALETDVLLGVRVSDLGVPGKATTFEVTVAADQLLDELAVKGHAKLDASSLDAQMSVRVRGLHPRAATGYLVPAGIRPAADTINMQMSAALTAAPSNTTPGALTGDLAVDKVVAIADGEQAVRVDKVNIGIDSFDTLALKLGDVLVQGVRVSTGRTHDGLLRACGIELVTPVQPNGNSPRQAANAGPAFGLSAASVRISDCRLDLDDQAVTPSTTLAVQLDQFTIAAPAAGGPLAIVGKLTIPGVAKTVDLTGSASPFAATRTAAVMLRVSGLNPTALKPYLNALGLESEFANGTFACDLNADLQPTSDGSFAANAHLSKLRLADGRELLGLDDVSLKGVSADARRIRFDSVAVSGPTLDIHRDANGAVSLLGFKTRPPVALPPAEIPGNMPAAHPASTMPAPSPSPAPRLEIGKFVWHGVHVHFSDEAVTPIQSIGIDDVGVELTDLRLGLDPQDYAQNAGKIKAWLVAPHFVDRFDLAGNVAPGPKALQLDVNGAGSGVSPSALAPYLTSLGLAPLTANGTVKFHAQLSVAHEAETLSAGLSLDQVRYADPSQTLLAVDSLKVGNVALSGKHIGVTDVAIDHPEARIERDHDGNLIVAGIKLVATSPVSPAVPPATQPATQPSGTPAAPPLTAELNSLHIQHAQLWWIDHAVSPAVNTSLTSDVDLHDLTIGKPGAPAALHVVAAVPDVIKHLDIAGQISPAPDAQSAHLDIAADGIVIGPLSSYLPPGMTSTLQDGSLRLALEAAIATAPKGGQSARLSVDRLDYRDAGSPTSLFKLGNLTIAASRIDPKGGGIAIDQLATHGIECDVTQLPGGKMRLFGLQIAPAPAAAVPAAKGQAPAEPVASAAPSGTPSGPMPDAAALVAAAHKALPLITLEKLDLNVTRFSLIDGARPAAAPLALENLQLQNKGRIEWLGRDPEARPPTLLLLTSRVSPLVDRLSVGIKASPFARQPTLSLDLDVSGIHGDGLTKYSPDLQKTIDGSGMTNGQLAAHVEATLKLDRHSPIDFDLSHPFGVEFDLTNVKYRSAPNGPILAGIDEVRSEGVHMVPATGDVTIKTIELTNPTALLVRDTDGIHALGWVLKSQSPATQPSTQPSMESSTRATSQPAQVAVGKSSAPPAAQPAAPRSEIKIDHIVASGMNVRIEDHTTKPITVLPLSGLDLEIRELSSLALYQDKPFRFNALINSGKVSLPARSGIGDEDRDLFSQWTAGGKIGLYPELNGWSKIGVSGFDLAGVTAEAAGQNITLSRGAFDADINLRFEPGNVIAVQSKLVFTDMSLAEPSDGLITRLLKLPAPLDVVLGALEDPDGSITLPVNFSTKDLQPQGLVGAATGAVGSVIVVAVASAPVKAVNAVTGIFGLGPKKPGEEQPVMLAYPPGAILLGQSEQAQLSLLAQRMIKEPSLQLTIAHQFGNEDAKTVAARANPSADEARGLAYRLRARKLELSRLRSEVSGQAEAQLATLDDSAAAPTLARLRAIDHDLAVTEIALDRTYDMLRPGAERQADRRTRAAALEIASQRLDVVRAYLRSAGVPDADKRVKLIRPVLDPSKTSADSTVGIQPVRTKG